MMNRRTFMGTLGAGYVSLAHLKAAASIDRLGVQLYTVRTEMEKDVEATLARVAALGYKEVEFAGYFNRTPQQIRDLLAKNGLTAPSTHVDYASLSPEKFPAVIEASRTMGHKFIVNPWLDDTMRKDPDIWKKVAETYNRAGEMTKKAGIQFAYHNHNFEFVPVSGKLPYDYLLETCDRNLVKMELDLCWIASTGQDPVAYFRKYPGRFPMVHVKGLAKVPATGAATPIDKVLPDVVDVGQGDAIDWKRIFAQSKLGGIEHYFVEHDVPKMPFDSLKNSYNYLKTLQF
jgi:sugar phosphate isomerase/epimerase